MALKNPYQNNTGAYHKVSGILITRRNKKICIQSQVFSSKESHDSGALPIITREHAIKKPQLILESYGEAENHYNANQGEVTKNTNEEISKLETESKKKFSQSEKRVIREKVLNRLIAKKAEEIGSAKWEKILSLQNQIVGLEYDVLKTLQEFSAAEDV